MALQYDSGNYEGVLKKGLKILRYDELRQLEKENAAVNVAVENIIILSDYYASEDYRKHLAKVYLKKALQAVVDK